MTISVRVQDDDRRWPIPPFGGTEQGAEAAICPTCGTPIVFVGPAIVSPSLPSARRIEDTDASW